ncbi:eIF2A-related protein [Iningainema tapete]|uniref:Caspase family protein n=1 Tax=Iningainema tapete BLCC-T55 TaxID=2748662 RepID=A0A8J6XG64_9CYAN|nr:caspase family protein [Iningainema tapete]MBD2773573.1 caspase family protein [Iningainema tapete BLCC-T55]
MPNSKYEFQHNLAVIIGINNYSNGIPELETPVNDAEELAKVLKDNYQYELQILLNEKATLEELKSLLEDFKQNTLRLPDKTVQVRENDRFIFYFAGHGIVPADGLENTDNLGGYLVPQDARGDILLQKQVEINKILLPMQALNDALAELPCRHMLVILDCCFAGAFRSSLYRDIVPARKVYKQRYDRFIRDPAWQAIASAAHDQKAIDYLGCFGQRGKIGKHSPFAEALFEGLRGEADTTLREGDGIITATELYCYVRDKVEELTDEHNRRQTPGLFPLKKHDKGEYIFLLPNFDQDKLENAPALKEENNPYRGLKSYEEENSLLFFGRDELVKELYARICKPENPLTVVLGVSGSGKSSLVKAGLIPYLRENHAKQWYIIPSIRPSESPFAALAKALVVNTEIDRSTLDAINSWSETLKQAPRQFIDVIANLRQIPANTKLLLVIDQFEELITICKQQEREQFLNFLAQALAAHSHQLHVILTLRLDFEPRFLDSALKSYLTGARFPVRAMRSDELRQAIERPASEKMLDFKPPNLVDLLIDEVGQMPGALSLLSFTLSELYIKCIEQESRTLTEADYKDLGGVAGSLTYRATEVYNKLDSTQQTTMQRVMLRMVTIEGGESARRRVPESELVYAEDAENQRVKEILKRLDEARLIVGGRETGGEAYVEPAHDALVRGWNKLQEWKNEQQENLVLQQRLTPAANDWESQDRPTGLLLPDGDRLNQLEKIKALPDNWLNLREKEFISSSIEYRNIQQKQAKELRLRAQLRQKASKVEDLLPVQPLDGLVLAIQAMGQNLEELPNEILSPVQTSLHTAMEKARVPIILEGHKNPLWSVAFSPDGQIIVSGSSDNTVRLWNLEGYPIGEPFQGHQGEVRSVAFSPNGEMIVSGSFDNTVRLWNLEGYPIGEPFQGHEDAVMSVAFSPNGEMIVSGSSDNTVRLWNLEGNLIGEPFQGHEDAVMSVAFSPDGQKIVSGSQDNTVRLWDIEGNPIGEPFIGHKNYVFSVAFSPDGQKIVSGSSDNTVRLWDIEGNLIGEPFIGHKNSVLCVAFSPDGQKIVSGSWDESWRIWNLQGKPINQPFIGSNNSVFSVAFSPDGETIVSGNSDSTVRLWDLQSCSIAQPFRGHDDEVETVAFSPDSHMIVSGNSNGTVHLSNLQGKPIGQPFKGSELLNVFSVAFSPQGNTIVTANFDRTWRLWNLQGKLIGKPLIELERPVRCAAFSPQGNTIVTASDDGLLRLWDLQGNLIGKPFIGHESFIRSVAFSPQGNTIVSAGDDLTVRLWNIDGIPIGKPLIGHQSTVYSVTFSPDGGKILSGGDDKTLRLWDIEGNPIGEPLLGHEDTVTSVAFSPDAQTIVSGSRDRTLRLWDTQGNPISLPFEGHEGFVNSVAFSPDGQYIVSGSSDNTVRLWRGKGWKAWLEVCCNRLRYHPIFKNPKQEVEKEACETCQKYV